MTELNPLTKELAETLKELRTRIDKRMLLGVVMVKVDAVLDQYEDACKQSEEPMTITKPTFYDSLTSTEKSLYNVTEKETSKQWAEILTAFVDKLGGDGPALWQWAGLTPTPEAIVEKLQELFDFHMQIAADNELEECCDLVEKRYSGCTPEGEELGKEIVSWIRNTRRPQPTLKSQALKDLETVRKNSDILPEILDTIEKALQSIPE